MTPRKMKSTNQMMSISGIIYADEIYKAFDGQSELFMTRSRTN